MMIACFKFVDRKCRVGTLAVVSVANPTASPASISTASSLPMPPAKQLFRKVQLKLNCAAFATLASLGRRHVCA